MNKKDEVLELIRKQTAFFDLNKNPENFTADYISENLNLKRNTVSKYLNYYCTKGFLIKILSRPVLFLHKREFETNFFPVDKNQFDSINDLFSRQPLYQMDLFSTVIGHNGSLSKAISELKTSVFYPENGLPVLITGDSGTGKNFLAEMTYKYAIQEGFIEEHSPFIVFNCAQYINNPELLASNLFGYVRGAFTGAVETTSGAFEKANGGYLFLDEVHRLSPEGQEKLFTYLDKGVIYRVGDTKTKITPIVRLIFATTESIDETFLTTFIRRIPLQISLPDLKNRPTQEKEELLIDFLIMESKKINKPIRLSNRLISIILNHQYEGNAGELKSTIKYMIANTFMKQKNEEIIWPSIFELPEELLVKNEAFLEESKSGTLDIYPYSKLSEIVLYRYQEGEVLLQTCTKLYHYIIEEKINLKSRSNEAISCIQQYFDYLIFNSKSTKNSALFNFIYTNMKSIFELIKDEQRILFGGNSVLAISYYFYHRKTNSMSKKEFFNLHEKKIVSIVKRNNPEYWKYAEKILNLVQQQLGIQVDKVDSVFITLFLFSVDVTVLDKYECGVIVAHGYSTASSIANVVNRFLNHSIFEAFDMEIDVLPSEVSRRVLEYCRNQVNAKGIIVLVDMGSLKSIYKILGTSLDVPIGIINHVSTQLALTVGEKILNGLSVKEIVDSTVEEFELEAKTIFPEKYRKRIIITTCRTGIGTAERIKKLLEKSLDGLLETEIKPIDFNFLITEGGLYLKKNFEVVAVVGTEDPQLRDVPFFSLEDLIIQNDIYPLLKLLDDSINEQQKEEIRERIVEYFSLERVIDSLTILDSKKVISNVSDFIKSFEMLTQKRLDNTKKISLFVHVSCLIERLIRNEPIKEYTGKFSDKFMNRKDCNLLRKAFSGIESEYSVHIPNSELHYVCDIITGQMEYINKHDEF